MKILLDTSKGVQDITFLITNYTWSGDVSQVSRKLDFGFAVSNSDYYLKKVYIGLGDRIILLDNAENIIFSGRVFHKEKSHQGCEMKITAYDDLIYLIKSKTSKNYRKITADAITIGILNEFGVPVGTVLKSPLKQSFAALNKSGYEIIMTAYTNVSKSNGKKYIPIMLDGKANVIEKGSIVANYVLDSDLNINGATYSESIENMVNQVIITDSKGERLGVVKNADWLAKYGLLQQIYQQEENKDAETEAKYMLHGLDRTASVEGLGNLNCITGYAVKVKEAYTGIIGLFFIDSDTHTFQNGHYTMQLGLNFANIMDEKEG